jgi:hypothetical protein
MYPPPHQTCILVVKDTLQGKAHKIDKTTDIYGTDIYARYGTDIYATDIYA